MNISEEEFPKLAIKYGATDEMIKVAQEWWNWGE
jgi:hypothetical protein